MFIQTSPSYLDLVGVDPDAVRPYLEYHDKRADFALKKFKDSERWFVPKYGQEAFSDRLEALKAERKKNLLYQTPGTSGYWTYPGLKNYLTKKMRVGTENRVHYPEPQLLPWKEAPKQTLRPYQEQMVEKLILARHGAVEVGTGLGKSLTIVHTVKHFGLQTLIMCPSKSICSQLHDDFLRAFGKKYVGQYGGGKKEIGKKITIAIDDSLANIEKGSEAWDFFSQTQVFGADESHLCPAQTLADVCFGLVADSPYRFFWSGTQMRNDGLDLVLDAITGDIVFRMTVREGVDQGYLAQPLFRMVSMKSRVNFYKDDPNAMTRRHLYYNADVNQMAASIANQMVSELSRPVVILIEELEQFQHLLPYLKHPVQFAHAPCSKDNVETVPEAYRKSDPVALVDAFNNHRFPILVGTSCIGTGTDIRDVQAMIYLQGGKSEVQVKQAVGRGTRLAPGKKDCFFVDFDVDTQVTHRHALARREIYNDIYPNLEEMRIL